LHALAPCSAVLKEALSDQIDLTLEDKLKDSQTDSRLARDDPLSPKEMQSNEDHDVYSDFSS
jgi:hypothetical protein